MKPFRWRTRGAILLEVMLSIALFTGAALFALRAMGSAFEALDRSARQQQALDLATSTFAQLEVGLINLSDLREGDATNVTSTNQEGDVNAELGEFMPRWGVEVQTQPTEFEGLTLVIITVREEPPEAFASSESEGLISVTLHQLMSLTAPEPESYREDELVEDLVEPREDDS